MENGIDKITVRKEQIRNAALRCFSQYGFNKTTMDDIANAIGIKKASLYYYFKNKEDIFRDMIDAEVVEFLSIAKNNINKKSTATEKLLSLVKTETQFFQQKVSCFDLSVRVILETQPIINQLLEKYRKTGVNLIANIIRTGINNGEFRKCNANRVAESIRSLLDSIKFREFHSTHAISASDIDYSKIEKNAKYILNLLINGIKVYS